MPLPTKKEDLEALGYVFDNEAKCRYCGALIEWWITKAGAKMPMSVVDVKEEKFPYRLLHIERRPHFSDCEPYPGKKKYERDRSRHNL